MVVYNGMPFSYVKNLQGDIVAILNTAGNVVVSYVYDAWGHPISCSGTMASTLGKINPFRYRGYVYDEETRFYYLRSRYYNPNCCRFLNADAMIGKPRFFAYNSYGYCYNNCVTYNDIDGFEADWTVFEVHIRKYQIWMYDANECIMEPIFYQTGTLYTTCEGVLPNGTIPVYYFDSDGDEHTGYVYDSEVIVWYGQSPKRMNQYRQRYFGDFFHDEDADINFLREGNSYQRKNAALNVMLKKFLEIVEVKGMPPLFVNDEYSYHTKCAVEAFQDHCGIGVDGIVGRETIDKLFEFFVKGYEYYAH